MDKPTPKDSTPKHEPSKKYEDHWKPDGTAHDHAPNWAKYRTDMASEFPSPFRGTSDPLARQIERFVERLDTLRPEAGGPAFLGKSGALAYTYPEVKNVKIPEKMGDLDDVLDDVVKLFEGAVNWGNPLTMCNVIPQPNTAAVIASMLSQVFPANILEAPRAHRCPRGFGVSRMPQEYVGETLLLQHDQSFPKPIEKSRGRSVRKKTGAIRF